MTTKLEITESYVDSNNVLYALDPTLQVLELSVAPPLETIQNRRKAIQRRITRLERLVKLGLKERISIEEVEKITMELIELDEYDPGDREKRSVDFDAKILFIRQSIGYPAQTTSQSRNGSSSSRASTAHMNNNSGQKKYNCEECGKFFSKIYNKRRHVDMFHSNNAVRKEKAEFKCSSCDKVFNSIYNKTRHENVHKPINERLKYKCLINDCNKSFTTQFILKMHIKKVHQMVVRF